MIHAVNYNNKILSPQERAEFRKIADQTINDFSESIEGMHKVAKEFSTSDNSAFQKISETTIEVSTFINISFCDCIVLTKLFILATHHYEKRCLRGKLKVLLNESFKKLYGFNDKGYKDSYCAKLEAIIHMFPGFQREFYSILSDLKQISRNPWWKDERNAEVHIDVVKLYEARQEEINESKVAIETMQLTKFFHRLNGLLARLNRTCINYGIKVLKEQGVLNEQNIHLLFDF